MRSFHGNAHADAHARLGALSHDLDATAMSDYQAIYRTLGRVARHVAPAAERSTLFSQVGPGRRFLHPPRRTARAARACRKAAGHKMVWLGHCFRCVLRCKQSRSKFGPKTVCEGLSATLRAIIAQDWGHDLAYVMVSRLRVLYFCRRCGAYAETRVDTRGGVGLTKPCGPPSRSSKQSLSLIMAGRHPTSPGPFSMSKV